MTKEELETIRRADKAHWRGQGEEVFRQRRHLLDELDCVTVERNVAQAQAKHWAGTVDAERDPETGTSFEAKYLVCKALLEEALKMIAELSADKRERDEAASERN